MKSTDQECLHYILDAFSVFSASAEARVSETASWKHLRHGGSLEGEGLKEVKTAQKPMMTDQPFFSEAALGAIGDEERKLTGGKRTGEREAKEVPGRAMTCCSEGSFGQRAPL